jgi:DNA polymerase I
MKKNSQKKRIVLLDTHAILHRAYHALPDFLSPEGVPTGALYGLTAFLLKILDELEPDYIIAAYDLPEPTLRHEVFAEYKANREKTDDTLVDQLIRSREVLDALSVPRIEAVGYEADDVLGTLAKEYAAKKTFEVIIASGDMDTLQLVDGDVVRVYTLKKGINDTVIYNEVGVKERYGFGPSMVPDYKGLRGDPSDNIPGVRGIGEKTATTLLTTFGNLDAIYKAIQEKPHAFHEAKITPRIVNLLVEGEDDARFSKELATICTEVPITLPVLEKNWIDTIDTDKASTLFQTLGFRTLLQRLKQKLGKTTQELVFAPEKKHEEIPKSELQELCIALWLLRSDITHPTEEEIFSYTKTHSFTKAKEVLFAELKEKELWEVYTRIEQPLIPVIDKLEERGILLDKTYLLSLSQGYHAELDSIAKRIFTIAGKEFNINSPKQLGEVLFDTLDIGNGKGKKTATGQRSTREDELKKYDEPIIKEILEHRELQKLLSTYIDNLPQMTDDNGRLHAHFSQTGTTTGRMSSQSPNMQNIPIKTPRGFAIRKAIIAPEGYTLLAADYSQIELRVAAFLSQDEKLITYFKNGLDAHTEVAAQVFDVSPEEVTGDMRRKAKVINFGILYGMGVNALADATNTSKKEAKQYLEAYFERFSGIATYIESIKNLVKKEGYTKTWYGRRRYFEGVKSPLPHIQAQAERMAVNAPIQGTSADIIKLAMIRMDAVLEKHGLGSDVFLIAQIHDELLYEVKTEKLTEVAALLRTEMESVLSLHDTLGVPLLVDVEAGKNWGEMTRVEKS